LGGDCDTLTAIAGSIAEGFYGVPDALKQECRNRLPQEFLDILSDFDKVRYSDIAKTVSE
jgi:ADP-ribosylglycohydrolase